MTSAIGQVTILFLSVCLAARVSQCQMLRTPSPPSEFILLPSNTTVPEGEQTIIKCLVKSQVHVCRWFFLELGLDFFSKDVSPMLVKDFKPAQNRDCSIRIKKVRKIQEGQWLCQALKFDSTEILMTHPAVLRVITRSEGAKWVPTSEPPVALTPPRQSRHNDEEEEVAQPRVTFEIGPHDYVQNTQLDKSMNLTCKVNNSISSCVWLRHNEFPANVSLDEFEDDNSGSNYKIRGDLNKGQCSLHIEKVQYQDEGDWMCVVQATGSTEDHHGPLLHLHITDLPFHSNHTQNEERLVVPDEGSSSVLVIILVLTCTILLILVILLFSCLYRRVAAASEETHKILDASPQSSLNRLTHKAFPTTDLTAASVLAVDSMRSIPAKCKELDQYNHYLDMSGSDNSSGSYVMMPNPSLRSSMSSRTTLSTLPVGRARSASSSTVLSRDSTTTVNVLDNPSYNPNDDLDSQYYADHIYEEIKDKRASKIDNIPEGATPTYSNLTQDYDGYLVPKSNEIISAHLMNRANDTHPNSTLPRPRDSNTAPLTQPAPPYSRVGESGLVAADSTTGIDPALGPGYSRVGSMESVEDNTRTDRTQGYDVPPNPMERYDVPRPSPAPVNLPLNIPVSVSNEAYVQGLTGVEV